MYGCVLFLCTISDDSEYYIQQRKQVQNKTLQLLKYHHLHNYQKNGK